MVALVLGMVLCVALAVWVVALVAVPARREGRDLLTPRGEHVVDKVAKAAKVIDPLSATAEQQERSSSGASR